MPLHSRVLVAPGAIGSERVRLISASLVRDGGRGLYSRTRS